MSFPLMLITVALSAQQADPAALSDLAACRQQASDSARLACFESAFDAFEARVRTGDISITARPTPEETRARFGLGPVRDASDDIDAVEGRLASARQDGEGRWIIQLEDGARWRQADSSSFRFDNTPGVPVSIRRGAVGSYLLTVGDSRAIRVRRL